MASFRANSLERQVLNFSGIRPHVCRDILVSKLRSVNTNTCWAKGRGKENSDGFPKRQLIAVFKNI